MGIKIDDLTAKQGLPKTTDKILSAQGATVPSTFLGRTEKLTEIKSKFQNGKPVLINGEGGIGKTTLAAKYWTTYENDYKHLAWLFCKEGIINNIIAKLALPLNIDIAAIKKPDEQIAAIKTKLVNLPKDCLLVLDNANDEAEINNFITEFQGLGWHVLMTSRFQKVIANEFYVDPLPPSLGIRLFMVSFVKYYQLEPVLQLLSDFNSGLVTGEEADEKLKNLFAEHAPDIAAQLTEYLPKFLNAVGNNTLVIEIFANTLAQLAAVGTDFPDFLKKLDETGGLKLESFSTRVTTDYCFNIRKKTATTDEIIDILYDVTTLNEKEKCLLTALAILPAENQPLKLLIELFKPEDKLMFSKELNNLAHKGWIFTDTHSYRISPIVQKIILHKNRERLENCGQVLAINTTVLLEIAQTKDNPVDKFMLAPYGKAIEQVFAQANTPEIGKLQNNLALVLKDLGDYGGAKGLLEKAVHSDEKNFGPDHSDTATSYSNLALVLKDLGDYGRAKGLLEKAVHSDEKNFGPDHPKTATCYANLASVLQDLGDYGGAKGLLEKAVQSHEKNFGPDHPNTATSYSNLASVLCSLKDFRQALVLAKKAHQIFTTTLPPGHPDIALAKSWVDGLSKLLGE